MLADECEPPPGPRLGPPVGYAPRLCPDGPSHYARRDGDVAELVVWRCVSCGLSWRTDGGRVP